MKFFRSLYLPNRFFVAMGAVILATALSYAVPFMLAIAKAAGAMFVILIALDIVLLYRKNVRVSVTRSMAPVLSLGDDNPIRFSIANSSGLPLRLDIIDEIPYQFQMRDFEIHIELSAGAVHNQSYLLRPLSRGVYVFGQIHVFISSWLGLIRRRTDHGSDVRVAVYPSIIQMKKYELKTFARTATEYGVKKVRRIGHSYEFDHIKQYVRGDDYRSINWKATGRKAQLMVNQYEDEKSQQVYCIIDKSRVMHMPFYGLSLLDYAVNAALVISNIVLGKQDKAGLITFADRPMTMIKADRSKLQLRNILDSLYKEKETSVEANYENLYRGMRHVITGRSLIFLYTNFESTYALQRVLPQLRKMNDQHLLVVIIFENTEITADTSVNVDTLEDVYRQITAEHYAMTKIQIAQQLKQFGIFSILTKPENLTVASINKYLELKSRGMI